MQTLYWDTATDCSLADFAAAGTKMFLLLFCVCWYHTSNYTAPLPAVLSHFLLLFQTANPSAPTWWTTKSVSKKLARVWCLTPVHQSPTTTGSDLIPPAGWADEVRTWLVTFAKLAEASVELSLTIPQPPGVKTHFLLLCRQSKWRARSSSDKL